MQTDLFKKIVGRYIYIEKIDFPLNELKNLFSFPDLYYIFGENISEKYYLEEVENDTWSYHLIFKLKQTNRIVGYLRIIWVRGLVEIHGGGLNSSLIEKISLSEAWFLIIRNCFQTFHVNCINTSCMINNKKAYKFITDTGFKEINRDEFENRINLRLEFTDFIINPRLNKIKEFEVSREAFD